MKKLSKKLAFLIFLIIGIITVGAQDFSARDKMIIYSECLDLLDEYQRLVNGLSESGGKGFEQTVSTGESLIELFINRKVLIYNDLDPQHQLSEYYELETYTSNMVMWYPDGMQIQMDLKNAKTGDIRMHDEGLYSTDIMVNKRIQGNYLNKSFNSNTEELIFRIAFIGKNKKFDEYKIVGIRESKSAGFIDDNKALYKLKSIELTENDKEKILNGIKQVLNDYQRSLLMLGDPNEPDDEKDFYKDAFLRLFPDEQVRIFNDIEENPQRSIITVREYLDNYLGHYPEGIRNLAINIDSAEFGDIIPVNDDQFFSYVYADKFFSGKFQGKNIFRLSTNLVFKIILDKSNNMFTNFKIESIDRGGLDFYQSEEATEQAVIPGNTILTVNRRGFHFSPFVTAGYSEIVNKNLNALSLEKDYHQWGISYSFAFSGGVNVDYFPWNKLGIGTGLEYNRYSAVYSLDGRFEDKELYYDVNADPYYKRFDSEMDSIVTMSYLNIPLQLTYFTNKPDRKGFYIKSGIRFSLFLDGNYEYRGTQSFWGYYPNHDEPADSLLIPELGFYDKADHEGGSKAKKISISARFSVGLNIPTGYFSAIYFGPVLDLGISSISANDGNYYDIFGREHQQLPTHINYLGWEIGMRFY
ncbi:MAG: outer membrane beta-barrel protein [Bacteroidales bacterium]|nr:outer membrane beta-barrel protein [Bacteroidales bacterium]